MTATHNKETRYNVSINLSEREFELFKGLFQNCPIEQDYELVSLYEQMFYALDGQKPIEDEIPF